MCVTVIGDVVEFEREGEAVRVRITSRGQCAVEIIFPTRAKFLNAFAGAATLLESFDEPPANNVIDYTPRRGHAETA